MCHGPAIVCCGGARCTRGQQVAGGPLTVGSATAQCGSGGVTNSGKERVIQDQGSVGTVRNRSRKWLLWGQQQDCTWGGGDRKLHVPSEAVSGKSLTLSYEASQLGASWSAWLLGRLMRAAAEKLRARAHAAS